MGQVQGEKPRVHRMRGAGMGEGADAGIAVRKQAEKRARGKELDAGRVRENQVKAMLVDARNKRDSAKREEQRKTIQSLTPANLRQSGRYAESDRRLEEELEKDRIIRRDARRARRGGRF